MKLAAWMPQLTPLSTTVVSSQTDKKTTVPTVSTQNDTFQRVADTVNPLEKPQPRSGNFKVEAFRNIPEHLALQQRIAKVSTDTVLALVTEFSVLLQELHASGEIDLKKPQETLAKLLPELNAKIGMPSSQGLFLVAWNREAFQALKNPLAEYPELQVAIEHTLAGLIYPFGNQHKQNLAYYQTSISHAYENLITKPLIETVQKFKAPFGFDYHVISGSLSEEMGQPIGEASHILMQANLFPLAGTQVFPNYMEDALCQKVQLALDEELFQTASNSMFAPLVSQGPPRPWSEEGQRRATAISALKKAFNPELN